jgi:hypothetical protein
MIKLWAATLLVLFIPTATALAAPQSFYGKTLRVSWNETRSQRVQGEEAFRSQSVPLSFVVYVSTKGQLFRRITSTTRTGKSGSTDRVGASTSGSQGAGSVSFAGNTLIFTANNGGLGRRIRVTFDGGSSCSAEVLTGKSGSGASSARSNATGKMLEIESVAAGSASCSVQDGNAFAG